MHFATCWFARVCGRVVDFDARDECLTAWLLQQGYRYRNTVSKFYCRHYELISKFNVGLKTLLCEGLSEREFYQEKRLPNWATQNIRMFTANFSYISLIVAQLGNKTVILGCSRSN